MLARMLTATRRFGLLSSLLTACGDPPPPAPTVELSAGPDTISTGYAEIVDATWLGGDRWAVVAPLDVTVAVVSLGARRVVPLGGEGTKEIRNPSIIFVTRDTLYVGDWGLRRVSLWTLDGRLVRALPAPASARGALPESRDDAGRWYLELKPAAGPDGSGNRDSALVVVASAGFERLDTAARLSPLDLAEVSGDAGRRFEPRALSGTDRWGVLPDGSLWVARVYKNRVDWRLPDGTWVEGDPLPDRVLEVTQYDRELFFRRFPPELRATAEQLPFAAVKPPFEAGFTSPAGTVWLEKSRAPADSARRYHEVDRAGRLIREIRVPGTGRIVAVGAEEALVAERVRDGTRFIGFPVPAANIRSTSGGAQ
jgi:hypothetical protein